jgi:hypothetical protein
VPEDDARAVPLPTLIEAYRTGRAHLIALEHCLVARGFLRCEKCHKLHWPVDERLTNRDGST